MENQNTRPPLDFTPEVAIKATGANGRLYTITAKRSSSDAGTTTAYSVSVFGGIYTTELEPSGAATRTLVDAMEKCIEHETAARKALAPTGLIFKPCIYFTPPGRAVGDTASTTRPGLSSRERATSTPPG